MDARGQLRPLFARPRFAILYASRLTSQASDGIFQACLVGYVLFSPQRATSPGTIAVSLAIVLLPFSVIGPFTGIILDRVARQRALVVSSVIRAGLLIVLAALIAADHTGVDFYVAALTTVSVSRFVNAALSACLPVVVPSSDEKALVTANALTTTSGTIATLLGAGLGSGVRGLIGGDDRHLAIVAGLAAVSYLAAALTAARAGRADFGPLEPKPWDAALGQVREVAVELMAGGRHLWNRRPARDALAALTAFRVFFGLVFIGTVLLFRNGFHGSLSGLTGLATVVTGGGVGTIAAAFATPRVTRRLSKRTWITITFVASGIVIVALGVPFSPVLFVLASSVLGFTATASKICVDTFVQEETEDAYRGRAFALYDLLFNVAYVAAAAAGALVLPASGRSEAMIIVIGLGFAVSGLLYYRLSARPAGPTPVPASEPGTPVEV